MSQHIPNVELFLIIVINPYIYTVKLGNLTTVMLLEVSISEW